MMGKIFKTEKEMRQFTADFNIKKKNPVNIWFVWYRVHYCATFHLNNFLIMAQPMPHNCPTLASDISEYWAKSLYMVLYWISSGFIMTTYLAQAVSIKTLLSATVSTAKYQRNIRNLLKTRQIVRLGEKELFFLVVKRHNFGHAHKC